MKRAAGAPPAIRCLASSRSAGDRRQAEAKFRHALALQTKLLGPEHPQVLVIAGNVARAIVESGRYTEALTMVTPAIAMFQSRGDKRFYALGDMHDTAGLAEQGLGHIASARDHYREALAVISGQNDPKEGDVRVDLAEADCNAGDTKEGLASLAAADRAYHTAGENSDWRRARLAAVRGVCLVREKRPCCAKKLLDTAYPAVRIRWGPGSIFERRLVEEQRRARSACDTAFLQ